MSYYKTYPMHEMVYILHTYSNVKLFRSLACVSNSGAIIYFLHGFLILTYYQKFHLSLTKFQICKSKIILNYQGVIGARNN